MSLTYVQGLCPSDLTEVWKAEMSSEISVGARILNCL